MKNKFMKLLSFILVLTMLINTSPATVLAIEIVNDINDNQVQENIQGETIEEKPVEEVEENTENIDTTKQQENFNFINQNRLNSKIFQQPQQKIFQSLKEPDVVEMEKIETKGNIEVEAHLALPIANVEKNNIFFTVYDSSNNSSKIDLNKINDASDGYYVDEITLGNQKIRVTATERDEKGNLLSGVDANTNVVYICVNLYSLNKGSYTIEFSGNHFVTLKYQ